MKNSGNDEIADLWRESAVAAGSALGIHESGGLSDVSRWAATVGIDDLAGNISFNLDMLSGDGGVAKARQAMIAWAESGLINAGLADALVGEWVSKSYGMEFGLESLTDDETDKSYWRSLYADSRDCAQPAFDARPVSDEFLLTPDY